MEKGDAPTVRADAWSFVDQANAIGFQPSELTLEIAGAIGHVVHGVAALGQKPGDGAIGIGWGDEFDPAAATGEGNGFDHLLRHHPMLAPSESETRVGGQCGIEIRYHDANMVQFETADGGIAHTPLSSTGVSWFA